jgi:ATP-dependent DNA helicase RecG
MMITEAIRVLKRNMRVRSIDQGIFRMDEWEYPEEVLREALVNALVHRDYSEHARGAQVQVELYPDRLIVRNPGGLYGPVDVTSLGTTTVSSSRNRMLLKILEDTPLGDGHMVCENRGTGIARMRLALSRAGMEPPKFSDNIGTFEAEFPNHTLYDQEALDWLSSLGNYPLTNAQRSALVLMKKGSSLTNTAYRSVSGIQDSRVAYKELKELVDLDIVDQVKSGGSTYYVLARKEPEIDVDIYPDKYTLEAAKRRARYEVTPPQRDILDALGDRMLTKSEIADRTRLTPQQVIDTLRSLRKKGYVEMVGQPRSKKAQWRATHGTSEPE